MTHWEHRQWSTGTVLHSLPACSSKSTPLLQHHILRYLDGFQSQNYPVEC